MPKDLFLASLICISLLFGCSPATLQKAENTGNKALAARELFDLVSGNSMLLTAYDFSGQVLFAEGGRLAGIDSDGQRDSGTWDISEDDRLCLKFKLWYYGDLKCYSVVSRTGNGLFSFFTPNGAAYYAAELQPGDPGSLQQSLALSKSKKFLRQQFENQESSGEAKATAVPSQAKATVPQTSQAIPEKSTTDLTGSVRRLTRDCPGCNLAGADLKEADLVQAELTGANLSGADLRYSNLRRAQLSGANLDGARLNHANLPGANLRDCSLRKADLRGANLLHADLRGADLTGAQLDGAYLENTKGIQIPQ